MNASRPTRRLWVVVAAPLLAVILIGILLIAVRSGENQPAPAPVQGDAAALPTETTPVSQPTELTPTPAVPAATVPLASATDERTVDENNPVERTAQEVAAAEIVAIVGDSTITLDDLTEATTIDAIMAGLAGQAPTPGATLLRQLINTEVVVARAGEVADQQAVAAALEEFLARTGRSYDDLVVALATNGVTQARFDRYFARLVSADAFVRSQQAATGASAADLLRTWQQEARISFGPIANSILGAVQTTAVAMQAPPAVVASGAPTAASVEEGTPPASSATAAPTAEPPAKPPELDPNEPRGVEVGQLAPEFTLPQLTESVEPKSLRNFLGDPSVLIFWTTWCPYCLRQTPALVEAHRQWREQGIQFVGINVKEDASVVEPYVQAHGIEYPVLLDADGVTAAAYAVQGYPTTYFLDLDNRIVARHVGALTAEQLNSYLQMLRPEG